MYLQPGWVGLSVVEAMAYGKPVLTFKRSQNTYQCVEYSYLKHGYNALIFDNINQALEIINSLSYMEIKEMSINAKDYIRKNLLMENMISNAYETL